MLPVEIILNKVLGTWSIVLVILGTIGNPFCLYICLRKSLRKTPTFLFLGFIAITDTISLYGWNLNHFIQAYWGFVMEDANKIVCKLVTFYQCFSLEASAWFLVTMCLERFLCSKITTWRKFYFNSRRALVLSLCILAFFMLINSHLFITLDYTINQNVSIVGNCYTPKMWVAWREVHTYIYSIVPFIFLAVINSLLLYQTVFTNIQANVLRSDSTRKRHRATTLTLVLLTAVFFVFTAPNAIVGIFVPTLFSGITGRNILFLCNCLGFSFHSLNILVFLFLNKQFSREVCKMFIEIKSKLIQVQERSSKQEINNKNNNNENENANQTDSV